MSEIIVTRLREADRSRWAELWRGYLDFYETQLPRERYENTWRRLMDPNGAIYGFGARESETGPLIGITHYLFHAHAWNDRDVCYLQDLFVHAGIRGRGIGKKLIEAVATSARERGCFRLYWTTKEDNAAARRLYDHIARFNGFIRYDYALE